MVQILQVTLREAEFKQDIASGAKTMVKIIFGQSEKKIPNPRMIKNNVCNYYGERVSLNSNQSQTVQKAYVQVTVIEGKNQKDFGEVEIDILKIKEQKQSSKVKLDLENQSLYLSLEVLVSSYGGTSEVDNRSQRSEGLLSPIRPKSTIGIDQKIKQALRNDITLTPIQKYSSNPLNKEPRTEVKIGDDKPTSRTFQLNKKASMNNFTSSKLIQDDRKSQISERPVRSTINRSKEPRNIKQSIQNSTTRSAVKPQNIANQSNHTSVKKIQSIKIEQKSSKSAPAQKQRKSKRLEANETKKPKEQQSSIKQLLNQFESKDYIQFVAVSVIAFIIGMLFKKS